MPSTLLLLLADVILILHVLFVAFVVLGLFVVYVGSLLNWQWVRNRAFRIVHLCAIGYVVIQQYVWQLFFFSTWLILVLLAGLQRPHCGQRCRTFLAGGRRHHAERPTNLA